jgi:hypothetical protein
VSLLRAPQEVHGVISQLVLIESGNWRNEINNNFSSPWSAAAQLPPYKGEV